MTQIRNLIDENGKRIDGRGADELRTVKITVGAVKNADGSAFIEFGKNKILAAVYGPREVHPKHMALPDRCVLRCRYHMVPFSTDTRKNPAPSRREIEISKVMRESLEPALMLQDYPRASNRRFCGGTSIRWWLTLRRHHGCFSCIGRCRHQHARSGSFVRCRQSR